jgi:hypothetical protein
MANMSVLSCRAEGAGDPELRARRGLRGPGGHRHTRPGPSVPVGDCLLSGGLVVVLQDLFLMFTVNLFASRCNREEGQAARAAQFYFRFLQIGNFFGDSTASGGAEGAEGSDAHAADADLQRTAPRRANSSDGPHGGTGSGSGSLLDAVLNTTIAGGGLDNINTSTYISKAVSALISQQQVVDGAGAGAAGSGAGAQGEGVVTAVDAEQAEALLFLAQYHKSINALPLATLFCSRYYCVTRGPAAI